MRYIWQHIQSIIDTYNGTVPLTHFLKNYCKQYPKLGSRDRRVLSDMAYCWYRCARGLGEIPFEQKMLACLQMCNAGKTVQILFGETAHAITAHINSDNLFPHECVLSPGMEKAAWVQSILVQPSLFIRIRKDRDNILALLATHNIAYSIINDNCLSLPNGSKIEAILPADCYVVQDASSQQTATFFNPQKSEDWYDCCSGAGGKSLLLKDIEPTVKLTVTDVRESILHNLKERFKLYGLKPDKASVADVADQPQLAKTLGGSLFDGIICDVPCSGSGTWARTPEQMFFFNPSTQAKYPQWQKNIATNAAAYLKPGGKLIYITCSVFSEENERVVEEVVRLTGLQLIASQLINGINIKTDSMFVAVLQRKST